MARTPPLRPVEAKLVEDIIAFAYQELLHAVPTAEQLPHWRQLALAEQAERITMRADFRHEELQWLFVGTKPG